MPGTTILVGLTGGIGSGKTTVSSMLEALGAVVIDADAISRSLTSPGGAAIPAIATELGSGYITAGGALNRDRMRELVYSDPGARKRLEAIIHPLVGLITQRQAREAMDEGQPCVVFDIPLLVESGQWRSKLHRIMVVDCEEETQIDRVVARNALSRVDVANIIAAQASRHRRLAAADIVIYNQGLNIDGLRAEVAQLAGAFGL